MEDPPSSMVPTGGPRSLCKRASHGSCFVDLLFSVCVDNRSALWVAVLFY